MARLLTLGDLHKHFEQARDKLTHDRLELLALAPLPTDYSHDAYSFSYIRAERLGMEAITHSLKEVAWLPMQLDPRAEIMLENRSAIKQWLGKGQQGQPNSADFGNDLIHALTRTAMVEGWHSNELRVLALRIGELFHDLSCLIGLIYYGVWMSENGIEGLPISNPEDLERTAQEIALLTRSPEVTHLLKQRKQALLKDKDSVKKHVRPVLRVVENTNKDGDSVHH